MRGHITVTIGRDAVALELPGQPQVVTEYKGYTIVPLVVTVNGVPSYYTFDRTALDSNVYMRFEVDGEVTVALTTQPDYILGNDTATPNPNAGQPTTGTATPTSSSSFILPLVALAAGGALLYGLTRKRRD